MRHDRRSIPRMFHRGRRLNWWLPLVAAFLAFLLWKDIRAETVKGFSDGNIVICTWGDTRLYPMEEFCVRVMGNFGDRR